MEDRSRTMPGARRHLCLPTTGLAALTALVLVGAPTQPRLRAQATAVQLALVPPVTGRPAFEVASIRPNKSTGSPHSNIPLDSEDEMKPVGGLLSISNMRLRGVIAFAYKLTGNIQYLMPGLPDWIDSQHFDIEARAEGNPTKDQFRLMVQSLLADRFKLTTHQETRELSVFALVLSRPGKLGPQLAPHPDDTACNNLATAAVFPSSPVVPLPSIPCGGLITLQPSVPDQFRVGGRGIALQLLASSVVGAESFERPIVDGTGLTGTFDFWLQWSPQAAQSNGAQAVGLQSDPSGPTLQEAVREQLGLKLEPQRALVDVIVVDRLEQPSEN